MASIRYVLALVSLCLIATEAVAQTPATEARMAAAANAADSLLAAFDRTDAPGVSVRVVRDGHTVYASAAGMASLEQRVAMHPATISDLGSVSKQFTAFAIALLAERGLLDLDDDIRDHLPEVPDFGAPIRIRHLVHHTSGLREIYTALGLAGLRGGDGIQQQDALRLVTATTELNFPPGDRYLYCNTAYMLLADIVSRVSGVPFPQWMRENVFEPLGMDQTVIMDRPGLVIPGAADSYGPAGEGGYRRVFDNSSIQGAGGMYSTTADLARWMDHVIHGLIGDGEAWARMRERGMLASGDTLDYAFGINVGSDRGLTMLQHGGASAGYRSLLRVYPELDGGLILLANGAAISQDQVDGLADAFFGDRMDHRPQDAEAGAPAASADEEPAAAPPDRRPYEGRFLSDELETIYRVTDDDGTLILLHRRLEPVRLIAAGGDRFTAESSPGSSVTFERDASGAVVAFRIDAGRAIRMLFRRID